MYCVSVNYSEDETDDFPFLSKYKNIDDMYNDLHGKIRKDRVVICNEIGIVLLKVVEDGEGGTDISGEFYDATKRFVLWDKLDFWQKLYMLELFVEMAKKQTDRKYVDKI